MPPKSVNHPGGKRAKKASKGKRKLRDEMGERDIILCQVGRQYAQVVTNLGDGRYNVVVFVRTGVNSWSIVKCLCCLMNSDKKHVHLSSGDIIMVTTSDLNGGTKCFYSGVKYTPKQASELKSMGELPEWVGISATTTTVDDGSAGAAGGDEDVGFDFEQI